jgi:hypothetical protein
MSNDLKWRFKKWDVRCDGKVFWHYNKTYKNGQRWITWDQALKYKEHSSKALKAYNKSPEAFAKRKEYKQSSKGASKIQMYNQREEVKSKKRAWSKSEIGREYHRKYMKHKRDSDHVFSIASRVRTRINMAILQQGYSKTSKNSDVLGCTWDEFAAYIKSKFLDGMTFENRNLWHIDHIIPLASANSEEEIIKLNHYTNLQPLWAIDNLRKGCKITTQP